MTNLELFKEEQKRIQSGNYKLGDSLYTRCQDCSSSISLLKQCTYVFKYGVRIWQCGFCEREIKVKKKENKMVYKIAVDADSIISKALHRQPDDLEKAYYEVCANLGQIKGAIFFGLHEYEKGDEIEMKVILTPRTNFRYNIFPDYKNKRPPRSESRIELMKMVLERLKPWVEIHAGVEADDVVIYYAKQGWMVAAIDKDVINACPTYCYNYNKYVWEQPKSDMQIESWYLMQALMGDSTDCIPGAKEIGEKGAFKIVNDMSWKSFANIIEYFDSYEDALLNMRLVRMDQWNGKEVILWTPDMEADII